MIDADRSNRATGRALRAARYADWLRADDWVALRRVAERSIFPAGGTLVEEGRHCGIVLVVGGCVKACVERGGRPVMVGLHGPGELVPDLAPLHGDPAGITLVALDRVDALVAPPLAFAAFLDARPRAALGVMRVQAATLREARARHADVGTAPTGARLARLLLELAERFGSETADGAVRIDVPLTQDDVAGWIGASHKATTTVLGALRRAGCVRTGRRSLTILDRQSLARIACRSTVT